MVRPPAKPLRAAIPAGRAASGHDRLKFILGGVFAVLVVVALAVVFLLPGKMTHSPAASAMPGSTAPVSPAAALPQDFADKPAADKLRAEALQADVKLKGEGVGVWGAEKVDTDLASAEARLKSANELYDQKKFTASLAAFRESIELYGRLEASKPERLRRAVQAGRTAYDAFDAARATAHYELALLLDPANPEAQAGKDRAAKLPAVLAGIAAGKAKESEGDLDSAYEAYVRVSGLDPAYVPVKAEIERLGKMIGDRDYQAAVSRTLALIDQKNFTDARVTLKQALAIRPAAPELREISGRIAAGVQAETLDRLRRSGASFERQEKWVDAVAAYAKALSLDATASFAAAGRARAQGMADLHAAIDRYLAEPARLRSPDPLAHARGVLGQAKAVAGAGPVLSGKLRRLEAAIAAQGREVPVTLRSDAKTTVAITRVGRFGAFTSRVVKLHPGTYTAVGSRDGYRDVRVEFRVGPDDANVTISIQCTEPIAQ
jgi:tetratricopeptide (TPR) repeat protein